MTPLISIAFLRAIFERFLSGYLLDTNVALLGLAKPELVSPTIRKAVERGPLYLSVVSYWEVTLKSRKGKLDVGDARAWWMNTLEGFAASPLLLRPEHVSAVNRLEPIHQDPFDRVLIAQAITEDLALLSTDRTIAQYASKHFRVLS